MATLTGTTIQSTYDSLLKVTDNDAITSTLKRITDGLGNNTPLYLSSSAVEITSGLNVIGSLTASNVSGSNTGDETKASIETKLGAATSSNNGYLTSGDWSTFNNKIAGSGTLNSIAKFSSTGSISDSNITDTGSLVTISGSANIAGSGGLGIAQTSLTGYNIRVSRQITGATTAHSVAVDGFVDSTVTTQANGFFANIPVTGAFTLPSLAYFRASGSVTTGGATITNQFGFTAGGGLVNATNNYAFHSSLTAGTGRWNLYMEGSANNYLAGNLGIGSTGLTQYNLRLERSITGNATSFSFYNAGIVQSDVTTTANYNATYTNTAAASFTLSGMNHYNAIQGIFGAGSTVTTQSGFRVDSSLIGATNNYGFRGLIPSGTGRWNLYMDGTANNYLAGSLGIGATSLTGFNIRIQKAIGGAASSYGIYQDCDVATDATSSAWAYGTNLGVAATTTGAEIVHYRAASRAFGAGATITNQYGFAANSSLTGATNNYAFYSSIAAGTGRWNIYMLGTADNYLAGSLGIGTTALTGHNLYLAKTITGAVTSYGVRNIGAVQSDVTTTAFYYDSTAATQATTFTLNSLVHYAARQGTFGAGSTVNNQAGFFVSSGVVGATNNYGFQGQIPAGTNRWNLYMDGTANNYMAGSLAIGTTNLAGINLHVNKNITGATVAYGIFNGGTTQSDVTGSSNYYLSFAQTQATTFTLGILRHYQTDQGTFGAGSTVTTQVGYNANSTLVGATNNYGFRGQIPSGTGRWNIYMDGTANNYLAGSLGIGTTSLSVTSGYTTVTLDGTNGSYDEYRQSAGNTLRVGTESAGAFISTVGSTAVRIITNSSERLRVTPTGFTLINATVDNGTGARLQVNGGITYTNIFNRRALNYTLTLTDQNDIVEMNVGSANTVTVPTNASVAFPVGTEIAIMQYGSGQTTIVASAGVTIRSKSSYTKIADQYTGATLVKVGTDEWYLVGNLTA